MSVERYLQERYRQLLKQQAYRPARPLSQVLQQLLARRSYGRLLSRQQLEHIWRSVVDGRLAAACRPGELRRSVLTVWVTDSAVLQELTFQKRQILAKIKALAPDLTLRDLMFRVDPSAVGDGKEG
ncbi:MAG: hypothetical protein KatS3mg110_3805 [Pirellulaceae bacterium]|nr:MAG: hypothetical protein KatS3mg110_3805 [Pirellulaceae bacterium]